MLFKIFSLEKSFKKLPKFNTLENLVLIIIIGAALLSSIVNAYLIEKSFIKLGVELGSFTIYLISSLFVYKQKGSTTPQLYRILCLSIITLTAVIDIKSLHLFHILFIFFLSLNFKKHLEVLSYPVLCFIIFIVKLESSVFDKLLISFFSILSLFIFILAFEEKKLNQSSNEKEKKTEEKIKKEIMIMNEATKLAALTEMSNGVAHEINNPLTIIAGTIQIMEMKMENNKLQESDLKNFLETVFSATERASHVVRSLEEFSRDGSKDPFQVISLKTLCLDSIDIFKERFNKLDVEIKVDHLNPLLINCKAIQVVQTLFHLISNSIFEIVNLEDRWIEFESKEDDTWIYLRLTDSGLGIPQKVVKSMFEPFVSQKTNHQEATGLGLSIAKIILKEHKGDISYELYKGHTSFLLKFPKPKA